MPGLTVDTSPIPLSQSPQLNNGNHNTAASSQAYSQLSAAHSQDTTESQTVLSSSASPVEAPPYSPITPTLAAARLASSTSAHANNHHASNVRRDQNAHGGQQQQHEQQYAYSHSQPAQVDIAPPPPIPIKFEENVDAVALKSAISILQMQKQRAERDVLVLQRVKERAVADPVEFLGALERGEVKSVQAGGMFDDDDEDDEEEDEVDEMQWDKEAATGETTQQDHGLDIIARSQTLQAQTPRQRGHEKWERLPVPQNIVRCPPINWNQYAVVGESLDRLHQDQVNRPSDGVPTRISPEGQYVFGGSEGQRRTSDIGGAIAAPYMPGRDRVDKPIPRKSAKKARTD